MKRVTKWLCPDCRAQAEGPECRECGYRRERHKPICAVDACGQYADIFPNGAARCWRHYREHMNGAGKVSWTDALMMAEMKKRTPPRPGEGLKAYRTRQGVTGRGIERIPGSDDDLGES